MVGETEVKERPKSNPDYLMQLMNDRKVMSSLPNFSGIFTHLERLLDEGNSVSIHFSLCTICHTTEEIKSTFFLGWTH